MHNDESPTDNMREERLDNRTVSTEVPPRGSEHLANENPPKPFKSKRIDLTPVEPMNVGYVGGVREPKKQKQ